MSLAFRSRRLSCRPADAGCAASFAIGLGAGLLRFVLCYVLPVWCCIMSIAGSAAAAMAEQASPSEPAPMCDPAGASAVAPEEIPEIDRGRFEALPCEAQLLLTGWRLDMPELGRKAVSCNDAEPSPSHQIQPPPRFEGARVFALELPRRAEPLAAELGAPLGLGASSGHAPGPFRPPVAR